MEGEIRNRVAENTKLLTFDLEEYYPKGNRIQIDLADWLEQGFILREKEYRQNLDSHDWSQYQNCYVSLHCSTDAILPSWAYMLFIVKIEPFVEKVVWGDLTALETALFNDVIDNIDFSIFQDKFVIIKGCSEKSIPNSAFVKVLTKIMTKAKSIMYGEACSSVPLFKRK